MGCGVGRVRGAGSDLIDVCCARAVLRRRDEHK